MQSSNVSPSITVIAGPTAVGKGTVVAELLKRVPQLWLSISATTREPRPAEQDGVHYYFLSEAEFDQQIKTGQMLEWAVVHGKYRYGTPKQPVLDALASGRPVLLEVDLDGARQIRQTMPQATQIFLAPPSFAELEKRLLGRGTEGPAERERRLQTAKVELAAQAEFDVVIVNDDVARATSELIKVMGITEYNDCQCANP